MRQSDAANMFSVQSSCFGPTVLYTRWVSGQDLVFTAALATSRHEGQMSELAGTTKGLPCVPTWFRV